MCLAVVRHTTHKRKEMNKQQKKEYIESLKAELKGYEVNKNKKRAEAVKKEIAKAGGKIETKTAKPKAEKKVAKGK